MQLHIPWLSDEDIRKKNQLLLIFPSWPSANQEILETLKTEYSQGGTSQREKDELERRIKIEKERPIKGY